MKTCIDLINVNINKTFHGTSMGSFYNEFSALFISNLKKLL